MRKSFSYKINQKLIDKSDGVCHICKLPLDLVKFQEYIAWKRKYKKRIKPEVPKPPRKKIDVNIDHIVPVSKGGTNDITNLTLAHIKCNSKKGNEIYDIT
jgi:5-methylcytosine-specific restriction endonuclease McrA